MFDTVALLMIGFAPLAENLARLTYIRSTAFNGVTTDIAGQIKSDALAYGQTVSTVH
ncbi:MAG: hypothetical protein WCD54_17190 [Pseudolabrys sp.]